MLLHSQTVESPNTVDGEPFSARGKIDCGECAFGQFHCVIEKVKQAIDLYYGTCHVNRERELSQQRSGNDMKRNL